MKKQTPQLFISFVVILSLGMLIASCAGREEGTTPIKRVGGADGGPGNSKPDEKAERAALIDKVLVLADKSSQLLAVDSKNNAIKLDLRLVVNGKKAVVWRPLFTVKIGEEKAAVECSEEFCDLGEPNLKLSVVPKRIAKSKNADSLGYLALMFQLTREEEQHQKTKKSLLLVLIDLDRAKNPKAFILDEVIYPVRNFSLNEWIDKQLKQL